MEPTIIKGSEITVNSYGRERMYIAQDDDVMILEEVDVAEFIDAVREHAQIVETPEPTPEKWYVVLKNSNYRLTNTPNETMVFTTYTDARRYARTFGGLERTYSPISVDEYERAFGR